MADVTNQTGPTIDTGPLPTGNGPSEANALPASGQASSGGHFDSGKYSIQKYNEIFHEIELYLENSGTFDNPNPTRYHINPAAVIGLQIRDTVNDWVVDGAITFLYLPVDSNPAEAQTGGQPQETAIGGTEAAAKQNGETLKTYQFRGDGFDLLRIMIIPKTEANGDAPKIDRNDTKWMLSYVFSIIDVEDVNDIPQIQGPASSYMKCLKLSFHDVRYQMLQTTNLEYSTSIPKDPILSPNMDSEIAKGLGVLNTGDLLRDIFNEAIANPEHGGCPEFKIPIENNNEWERGAGELFYTSPAGWSAADDVEYVFAHHAADTKLEGLEDTNISDMCLLHTNRPKAFGKVEEIVLTPLTNFFEKAGKEENAPGELQKEHFFVTSHTKEKPSASDTIKAPIGGDGKNVDFKTAKYGQILSYSFVDMSPSINSNMFCTKPVYSVDIGKREFNIQFTGNDIISARKAISKTYISKLYKEGADEEKLFLPVIHKTKKDLNIFPTFSLNGNNPIARQRNGIHNLIYTGLFQNACICFKVLGLTLRESGTFIGIDRRDGCENNDYNNKLYGQWFVVKVDHLFEAGMYTNIIYAVKLHRHKEADYKFEGVIEES